MERPDHLEVEDFNQLADEVKRTKIAHKMSDHLLHCLDCQKLTEEWTLKVTKHIEDLEKLA